MRGQTVLGWRKTNCLDGWRYVPNSYVNNDGKPYLNNSDVEDENNGRLAVRPYGILLRQPPIMRRDSVMRACSLSKLVSLATLSSNMARTCRAVSSAWASAWIRYVGFIGFGARLASVNCCSVSRQLLIVGSPREKRYFLSITVLISISFL